MKITDEIIDDLAQIATDHFMFDSSDEEIEKQWNKERMVEKIREYFNQKRGRYDENEA